MMGRTFWILRMVVVVIVALGVNGNALAQSPRTSAPEPVISEELMARLIKRTLASHEDAWINASICALVAMCDGTSDAPARRIWATRPDGIHTIAVPLKEGSKDIVVSFEHDNVYEFYLTDKTGSLRAAAISNVTLEGLRLITNEQAAEKFKAEMQLMAKMAKKLPPAAAGFGNR